jgi:hypothetical protein
LGVAAKQTPTALVQRMPSHWQTVVIRIIVPLRFAEEP